MCLVERHDRDNNSAMNRKLCSKPQTAGNALFLILIAVALFAALSYAVTQSGRGSGTIDREQLDLAISDVLQYYGAVQSAVQRLILAGGCTETTVRFWHADRANSGSNAHYGDGSNPSCQVFDPAGGAVEYRERPAALSSAVGSDEIMVFGIRVQGFGSSDGSANADGHGIGHDLVMVTNVTREACIQVNNRMGIQNPSGEPPTYDHSNNDEFVSPGGGFETFPHSGTGAYASGGKTWGGAANTAAEIAGFSPGCFSRLNSSSSPHYMLYDVIHVM